MSLRVIVARVLPKTADLPHTGVRASPPSNPSRFFLTKESASCSDRDEASRLRTVTPLVLPKNTQTGTETFSYVPSIALVAL